MSETDSAMSRLSPPWRRRIGLLTVLLTVAGIALGFVLSGSLYTEPHPAALGSIHKITQLPAPQSVTALALTDGGILAAIANTNEIVLISKQTVDSSSSLQPFDKTLQTIYNLPGRAPVVSAIAEGPGGADYVVTDFAVLRYYESSTPSVVLAGSAQLSIGGLAVTPSGDIYLAASTDSLIKRLPNGTMQTVAHLDQLFQVVGAPDGSVYVDNYEGDIFQLLPGKGLKQVFSLSEVRTPEQQQSQPVTPSVLLAFAPDGDLLVADLSTCIIWRVHGRDQSRVVGTGVCTTSPSGTPVSEAAIDAPNAMIVTPDFNLVFEAGGSIDYIQLSTP